MPKKSSLLGLVLFCIQVKVAVVFSSTPCGGSDNLLLFIDRPTLGDSACVVPDKQVVLESGYQYTSLLGGGVQQYFPAAFVRLGLVHRFEFNAYLPSYTHQTVFPYTGFDLSTLGIKHEVASSERWVAAVEGYAVLPSGSATFGSQGYGGIGNGIFSYNLNSEFNLTSLLGISSQTQPIVQGGDRYFSINPDLVLSWSKEKLALYLEVYGQSKIAPGEGSGFNMGTGLVYLIKKNIALDAEVGQRMSGVLFGFEHYVGAGVTVQLG